MSDNIVNTGIELQIDNNKIVVPLQKLMSALGLNPDNPPVEINLYAEKNGERLVANVATRDDEYVGIYIDGFDSDGNPLYLAHCELPTESAPDSIEARLYAGYADYETDVPIAVVTHDIRDRKRLHERAESNKGYTKIVHVDTEVAQSRRMIEGMRIEHAED